MGFILRREGDTTNPKSVLPLGTQTTAGLPAYWKFENGHKYVIVLLGGGERLLKGETNAAGHRGEGFFDGIEWYHYNGFPLTPYDAATDTGDYIFHPGYNTDASLGFADPIQGRPHFFPELDFTFSGRPYVETRLPENLSTDDNAEPTDSEIKLRTSCVWDYNSSGARVGSLPTFTSNNARLLAFACRRAGIDVLTRFDWASWVMFRNKCDLAIAWAAGAGDGLKGEYFNTTDLTGASTIRIDPVVDQHYGETTQNVSRRWTGFVDIKEADTYTFYTVTDDGSRLWVDGTQLIDDWTTHGALENSGSIALTVGKKAITFEYFQGVGPGEVSLLWSSSKISKQLIAQQYLFSDSTVATAGRTIPQFDADMVLDNAPFPAVFQALMSRAPGVKWQDVNGKITFLWAEDRVPVATFVYETGIPFTVDVSANTLSVPGNTLANGDILRLDNRDGELPDPLSVRHNYYVVNRTSTTIKLAESSGGPAIDLLDSGSGVSTYTKKSNIVKASVVAQRTDPINKPNFLVLGYRNRDDNQFTQGFIEINRDDLRDQANGTLIDPGLVQIGVARQSLAQRMGEAMMVKASDRDLEAKLNGQKSAHTVAKHDLVYLVHPRGNWRLTPFESYEGPVVMEVVEERFLSSITTANEKAFILKVWKQEYYPDGHGPSVSRPPGHTPSPLSPAPKIVSLTLTEVPLASPDGTPHLAISGLVQFDPTFPFDVYGRIWWRRPKDVRAVAINPTTNIFTLAAHGYPVGMPILFENVGGSDIDIGIAAETAYFVRDVTLNTFKVSATPGAGAIDIANTDPDPAYVVAPFIVNDVVIEPNKTTKQAVFSLENVEMGVHRFVIVPETKIQQKLSFERHTIYSKLIDGSSIPPAAMTNPVIVRDSSKYWLIQAEGHANASQEPATYESLFGEDADWTDEAANTKLTLPLATDGLQSTMFITTGVDVTTRRQLTLIVQEVLGTGDSDVTVAADGMAGTPITILIPVVIGDSPGSVAKAIFDAWTADADITGFFLVERISTTTVRLTQKVPAPDDPFMEISGLGLLLASVESVVIYRQMSGNEWKNNVANFLPLMGSMVGTSIQAIDQPSQLFQFEMSLDYFTTGTFTPPPYDASFGQGFGVGLVIRADPTTGVPNVADTVLSVEWSIPADYYDWPQWKRKWSSSKAYEIDDTVIYTVDKKYYKAISPNIGSVPSMLIDWEEFVPGRPTGSVREVWRTYDQVLLTREGVDPGANWFDDSGEPEKVNGRHGPEYTFLHNGNELSAHNFKKEPKHIVKISLGDTIPYPFRLVTWIPNGDESHAYLRHSLFGGAIKPSTVFSKADSFAAFGGDLARLFLRLRQVSKIVGVKGLPLDLIVPPL